MNWTEKEFANPDKKISLVTLFSGIGSVEYALKRCGLKSEILAACDIDPNVKKSYFANYDILEDRWYDDVTKLDCTHLEGKVDLLVGGSPCQSFSVAGKRVGLNDARGTLFYEYARCVKECQPKVFIYENVKGLTTHDNGKTFEVIKEIFESLNYNFYYKVLNSKDYGIPQSRNRIFVVGFKKENKNFKFPDSIPLKYSMQDFLEDFDKSDYYNKEKDAKVLGDPLYNNPLPSSKGDFYFKNSDVGEKFYLSEKMIDYILTPGTKNFKITPKIDNTIANTLLQSMHKMHRASIDNYVSHKGRIRKLTPRETLRLMGYGDDFKIEVSNTQIYRQTGNSIVVDVLIAIIKEIDITDI